MVDVAKREDRMLDVISEQKKRINEQVVLIGLLEAENTRLESLLQPSKQKATTGT